MLAFRKPLEGILAGGIEINCSVEQSDLFSNNAIISLKSCCVLNRSIMTQV